MASPFQEGTWSASPFISQYVDIIQEKILIIPDDKFETAQFNIEYYVKAHKSGKQIPLLFYASEFKEHFRIWVDDMEIALSQVPEAYQKLEGTPFRDFGYFFENQKTSGTKQVLLEESPSNGFFVLINDLKFFEIDLAEGIHTIRVEYTADRWVDRSDWVKQYRFRYALSPAKYWRSFGNLEITLDASNFNQPLTTNLDAPTAGDLSSKSTWTFSSLPTEVLEISYQHTLNSTASTLLAITPTGLTLLFSLLLVVFHLFSIHSFRKKNIDKRYAWTMIAGSIIVPFLSLLSYPYAFDIIDAAIGQDASSYHGYTFFIMALYPIVLPLYWIIMWLADRTFTRMLRERSQSLGIHE